MKRALYAAAIVGALLTVGLAVPHAVLAVSYMPSANAIGISSGTATIGGFVTGAVKILLALIGGLALVFILIGALQMTASVGSSQRYESAKSTLLNAVIGLVLAIAAYAVVLFISAYVH